MNFITECLPDLADFVKACLKVAPRDVPMSLALVNDLVAAKKFLLPPPDALNVRATLPALRFMKLPFPICAFEYSVPNARDEGSEGTVLTTSASSKRIALAYDCSRNAGFAKQLKDAGILRQEAAGLLVLSVYYVDAKKAWLPSVGAAYIDAGIAAIDIGTPFLFDNKHLRAQLDIYPIFSETANNVFRGMTAKQRTACLVNDVAEECAMAVRACLLLNTKNLKIVKVVDEPRALNKKRSKNGKPLFFEYSTVDIFVSQGQRLVDRKKTNYGEIRTMFTNLRSAAKFHPVAGHFKLRKTGMFWWNDFARGVKDRGAVDHEYQIKESK